MTLRLNVDVRGVDEFRRTVDQISNRAVERVREALDESAHAIRNNAVTDILHGSKTGRVYTHYMATVDGRVVPVEERSVPHQSSGPGEAPASDTGFLVNNITVDQSMVGDFNLGIASLAPYSVYLEYGTKDMEARPFMRPALRAEEQTTVFRVERAIEKALRG